MEITKGRQKRPFKTAIYGPPGVGKSKLAATAESALFINMENALFHLDIHSTPHLKTYEEVRDASAFAYNSDYKTIVYDCVDNLDDMIVSKVLSDANVVRIKDGKPEWTSLDDFGYGKGYFLAKKKWDVVFSMFNAFVEKGKNIILVGHSQVVNFKDPAGEDFDTYTIKMGKGARDSLYAQMDNIFYMTWRNYVDVPKQEDRDKRPKGIGDGSVVIHTEQRPAFTAKNRYNLPPIVDIASNDNDFFKRLAEM